MKKSKNVDVLKLLGKFQNIITHKPDSQKMLEEVQMMNFKVRPLQGDISILNLKDKQLIEALWSLGKLDEFFKREYQNISAKSRPLAFKIFQDLSQKFQERLNGINIDQEKPLKQPSVLEMEIIKESSLKRPN